MQVWFHLDFLLCIFIDIWTSGKITFQLAVVPWLCNMLTPLFCCPSSLRERFAKPGGPCWDSSSHQLLKAVDWSSWHSGHLVSAVHLMGHFLETYIPACLPPHHVPVCVCVYLYINGRYIKPPTFWRIISLDHIDIWFAVSLDLRGPGMDVMKIFTVLVSSLMNSKKNYNNENRTFLFLSDLSWMF